jgi:hypothetical protein
VSLGDARAGLSSIAPELDQRGDGLVDLRGRTPAGGLPPPRLLGAFEPVLLGWSSRDVVVGEDERFLVSGGIFRPFALVQGRAAATWTISKQNAALTPFRRLTRAEREALEADAREVMRFLGA